MIHLTIRRTKVHTEVIVFEIWNIMPLLFCKDEDCVRTADRGFGKVLNKTDIKDLYA